MRSVESADNPVLSYVLVCISAALAESVTYPLDLTKTRLQIQTSQHATKYRGMFSTAYGIAKEEGITRLWKGLTPAIYRHMVYSGIRINVYEQLGKLLGRDKQKSLSFSSAVFCGMTAGCVGQFFASPTDLVKVQMQADGRRLLFGQPLRYSGVWHAFTVLLRDSGVKGMWRGWVPNCQRAALVNLGELVTYDNSKRFLLKNTRLDDDWVLHGLSSTCCGFVAATFGTPADVVKTRIMNQKSIKGKNAEYRGSLDCLFKCVQREGVLALWKGFVPNWLRMAPWSLTFWLSYEELRRISGVGSF